MRRIDLTPEQMECIRDLYEQGFSLSDIGPKIGVNPTTLNFILKRVGFKLRTTAESQSMWVVNVRRAHRLSGENNPSYKGNGAQPHTGRARAKKLHPLKPDHCERCGCHKSETRRMERHHKDENPLNNERENILWVCAKCHKAMHPHPRWGVYRPASHDGPPISGLSSGEAGRGDGPHEK